MKTKQKIIILWQYFICLFVFTLTFAWAANKDVTIKVLENQSIRDISKQYLNDPDLWADILTANKLSSPHEVQPGIHLKIPVEAIASAHHLLNLSLEAIKRATSEGARIFAPRIISDAILKRNNAIRQRKVGNWSECKSLCTQAVILSEKARKICIKSQNSPAEAVVNFHQGDVHQRKPTDNVWKDVALYDLLLENDRIRTLSNSFAEILFKDNSRIQLKQNAQALIRKIRANLLENTQESSVKLINGDILALLSGKKSNQFDIQLPHVETSIRSRHFWVSRDKKITRIANYDGEIGIDSAGKQVVLEKNQGTIVKDKQKPQTPTPLLPPPTLSSPQKGAEIYKPGFVLQWEAVKNAQSYIIELSYNNTFTAIINSIALKKTSFQIPSDLKQGTYYWRVISISKNNLPGRPSGTSYFHLIYDTHPPYLVINHPVDNSVMKSETLVVSGITEKKADLKLDNKTIPLKADGSFAFTIPLHDGKNSLTFKAIDRAGNETIAHRTVTRIIKEVDLVFAPSLKQKKQNHFLTNSKAFELSGKTSPNATLTVQQKSNSKQQKISTIANVKGQFNMTLKLNGTTESFDISVVSEVDQELKKTFTVEVDNIPPEIIFDEPIPPITNKKKIVINGHLSDGELQINGKSVLLKQQKFNYDCLLINGKNLIQIKAIDMVGNESLVKKVVILDQQAPEIKKYHISGGKNVKGGDMIKISVFAKDDTALRKSAPFNIFIEKTKLTGFLQLNEKQGKYTGTVYVPEQIHGKITKMHVTLSDYLGNERGYIVNKRKG